MIIIDESIKKSFYFVSNIKAGTLTIIDSVCNTIIKEITVSKRAFKLVLKDNNTICVACDISNTILFVNYISGEIKENHIPNNGDFQINIENRKIFVSNTSEVTVYDINLVKLLGRIEGFLAIIDLKLNKDGSKLYVLDTLLKELRIYSTNSYKLLHSFKNLGINPTHLLISKDDKTAYISVKNNILKIDINLKIFTVLILPKKSLVAGMILKDNTLYASNLGLNRIELINVYTNKAYTFILTSRPEPTGLFITDDNTKLLVANRSRESHGGIDIIDLKSNSLISSILMNTLNSQPYDVISLSLPYTYVSPVAITRVQLGNEKTRILSEKIFDNLEEHFEAFSSFSGSIFPEDIGYPF